MIDIEVVENALVALVRTSTGFGEQQVYLSDQDGITPGSNYATIRIGDLIKKGRDAIRRDFDAARPAGQEVRRRTMGMRNVTVTFQIFTPGVTVGNLSARAIAAKLEADLGLPSVREPLNTVGLGILNTGNVKWMPRVDNTEFEGRAILDVLFAVPQGTSDATGYITKVNVTPTIDGAELPPIVIGS